jgi:hypothetical protein
MRTGTALLPLLLLYLTLCGTRLAFASPAESANDVTCGDCLAFVNQSGTQVINIIMNIGIVGTCPQLCAYLPSKKGEKSCSALCEFSGISAFVSNFVANFDGGPVCLCDHMQAKADDKSKDPNKLCFSTPGGKAKLTKLGVNPATGKVGTIFDVKLAYDVTARTGTGAINVTFWSESYPYFMISYLPNGQEVGAHSGSVAITTESL